MASELQNSDDLSEGSEYEQEPPIPASTSDAAIVADERRRQRLIEEAKRRSEEKEATFAEVKQRMVKLQVNRAEKELFDRPREQATEQELMFGLANSLAEQKAEEAKNKAQEDANRARMAKVNSGAKRKIQQYGTLRNLNLPTDEDEEKAREEERVIQATQAKRAAKLKTVEEDRKRAAEETKQKAEQERQREIQEQQARRAAKIAEIEEIKRRAALTDEQRAAEDKTKADEEIRVAEEKRVAEEAEAQKKADEDAARAADEKARDAVVQQTAEGDATIVNWQPDKDAKKCPLCQCVFGIIQRKHHCRTCGKVVCRSCSEKTGPGPVAGIQNGPKKVNQLCKSQAAQRRCKLCFERYAAGPITE